MAVDISYTGAVEGAVDEVALQRVVDHVGRSIGTIYVTRGKQNLLRRLPSFNAAARHAPWLVLVDLDAMVCAPELITAHLPNRAALMELRVVVREVEAWAMADPERLASFLGISANRVPPDPDGVSDPKQTLVNLARRSRRRAIREDLVPRDGSGRSVGPGYEARLIEFLSDSVDGWRPGIAARNSESLRRCLDAIG